MTEPGTPPPAQPTAQAPRFETSYAPRLVAQMLAISVAVVLMGVTLVRWLLGTEPLSVMASDPLSVLASPGVVIGLTIVLAIQLLQLPRHVAVTDDSLIVTRGLGRVKTLALDNIALVERTGMGLHVQDRQGKLTGIDYCRDPDGLAQAIQSRLTPPTPDEDAADTK